MIALEISNEIYLASPKAVVARRIALASRAYRALVRNDKPFVGTVTSDGFQLRRVLPLPLSSLPGPVVSGSLTTTADGTTLRFKVRPPWQWVLLTVLASALIAFWTNCQHVISLIDAILICTVLPSLIIAPAIIWLPRTVVLFGCVATTEPLRSLRQPNKVLLQQNPKVVK